VGNLFWGLNNIGATGTVGSRHSGESAFSFSTRTLPAFAVLGTPVPEPASRAARLGNPQSRACDRLGGRHFGWRRPLAGWGAFRQLVERKLYMREFGTQLVQFLADGVGDGCGHQIDDSGCVSLQNLVNSV
jgi:hypothetical protein